ncbi:hypothetical protein N0V82_006335 [Gnomoniopsis sp. IMI 355080]|nr:hypothetical protein N0V82_006335 [Gnomoniopsis sp. IMI 355080]
MKTSFVSLLALAAGAFAGRIGTVGSLYERDQTITVTTLTETIKTYTSSINSTLASVPENPTAAEQTKAINAIAPKLEEISDVLHTATKASVTTAFLDVDGTDLVSAVEGLVHEIVYTVKAVVEKLGLVNGLLVALKPLFIVLGSLVTSLDTVVSGLLVDVEGILNSVLSIVASVLVTLI